MTNIFWNTLHDDDIITCSEFLACRDPLSRHHFCENLSTADGYTYDFQYRDESSFRRHDTQQTPKMGHSVLDPPPHDSAEENELISKPQEILYYTSPVARINGDEDAIALNPSKDEWWKIPKDDAVRDVTEIMSNTSPVVNSTPNSGKQTSPSTLDKKEKHVCENNHNEANDQLTEESSATETIRRVPKNIPLEMQGTPTQEIGLLEMATTTKQPIMIKNANEKRTFDKPIDPLRARPSEQIPLEPEIIHLIDMEPSGIHPSDTSSWHSRSSKHTISTVSLSLGAKDCEPFFGIESEFTFISKIETDKVLDELEGIIDTSKRNLEPPADDDSSLRKSTLEPPGTIRPSYSTSIEALANQQSPYSTNKASTSQYNAKSIRDSRLNLHDKQQVVPIDLTHVRARSPASVQGSSSITKERKERGTNLDQNGEGYRAGEHKDYDRLLHVDSVRLVSSRPSHTKMEPPMSSTSRCTNHDNNGTNDNESTSIVARAGMSIGVSDVATTANWRRASSYDEENNNKKDDDNDNYVDDDDDDCNTSCACVGSVRGGGDLQRTGSNVSKTSIEKNLKIIFVMNNNSSAKITRIPPLQT